MAMVVLVCLVLLVVTTVIHYEVLRGLAVLLPGLGIKPRAKLIVVIIAAFLAHALEIALYALAGVWCALAALARWTIRAVSRSMYRFIFRQKPIHPWATATWCPAVRCASWPASRRLTVCC